MSQSLLKCVAIGAVTLGLVACGGSDEPEPADTTSTSTSTSTEAPVSAPVEEPASTYVRDPDLSGFSEDDSWSYRRAALRDGACHISSDYGVADYDAARCATARDDRPSYMVIGDSLAGDAFLLLSRAYPDIHFGQLSVPGCKLMLPQRMEEGDTSRCAALYRTAFNELVPGQGWDGVVIASDWETGYFYRIDDAVRYANENELELVAFGPRLSFSNDVPALLEDGVEGSVVSIDSDMVDADAIAMNETLGPRFGEKLTYIDMIGLQCTDGCLLEAESGTPVYLDDRHVSVTGAEILAANLSESRPEF